MNKNKIILYLCGGIGSWSRPYKEAGYDVRVITLPEQDVRIYIPPDNVYGILSAPPCTMFSLARTRAKKERCFYEGMEIVKSCLDIIWLVRSKIKYSKDGSLTFWCLENPMGFLRQFLGMPYHTFNPGDYGDRYTKKTDLWGYFKIPKKKPITGATIAGLTQLALKPFQLTEDEVNRCKINNRKLPSISDITGSNQAVKRAITPPGFAEAFFKANK